uniref:Uncharacterized protein n=1 Tax=Oryza punctata TaxID=4537 RepID=A0A0E0LGX1_ORYPU
MDFFGSVAVDTVSKLTVDDGLYDMMYGSKPLFLIEASSLKFWYVDVNSGTGVSPSRPLPTYDLEKECAKCKNICKS